MSNCFDDDLRSMEVDESPKNVVSTNTPARAISKVNSKAVAQVPKRSIIEVESSASSPTKSHRKSKESLNEPEVNSFAVIQRTEKSARRLPDKCSVDSSGRGAAFHENKKGIHSAPLQITLGKSVAESSHGIAKVLPPCVTREISRLGISKSQLSPKSTVPVFRITDLSEIAPRFAIEGRVLNNYGTFKLRLEDAKFPRFFKADIVDRCNSDTVTVVVEESLLTHFIPKLSLGRYVRIEGASAKRKSKVDGGTSAYSIYVDSATVIVDAAPFPISLTFYPECKIRDFLDEARLQHTRGAKQHLGTLAFVVIQADNLEPKIGATRGELLVADGPTMSDRAALTFVNDRKDDYANIVKDVERGSTLMFIARNIGVFMTRDNTLSVLDLTLLLAVRSARLKQHLVEVYDKQMEHLGYGKEIYGDLSFVNINGVLLELLCRFCKSNKVHKTVDGVYCVSCSKPTKSFQSARLQAKIRIDRDTVISTQLVGSIVDKVLHLQKPFGQLYAESVIGVREMLACTVRKGFFRLNTAGNVCDFTEAKT